MSSGQTNPSWMAEDTAANENPKSYSSRASSSSTAKTTSSTTLNKITMKRIQEENSLKTAAQRAEEEGIPIEALALLNDESFAHLRRLRQHHAWEGKRNKFRDDRMKKKEDLIHGTGSAGNPPTAERPLSVSAEDLEAFTERKRTNDKEEKIANAIELRANKQSFNAGKKQKSKINATHSDHSKRGKLFQMTKYSRRVGSKLKNSHEDRNKRDKFNKARGVKFRINRGWKA